MASSWNEGEEEFRSSVCEDDLEENYYSVLNVASNVCSGLYSKLIFRNNLKIIFVKGNR